MSKREISPSLSHLHNQSGCLAILATLLSLVVGLVVGVILYRSEPVPKLLHDLAPAKLRAIDDCIAIYKARMRPPDERINITEDDVRRSEAALGVTLPSDFVAFAKGISGYNGLSDDFRGFFGERAPHLDIALLRPCDLERPRFDPSLIAFYDTGYGDSVCFRVVEGQCMDRIYRFCHDDRDNPVIEEAKSFRAWLNEYIDELEAQGFRWNGTEWVKEP